MNKIMRTSLALALGACFGSNAYANLEIGNGPIFTVENHLSGCSGFTARGISEDGLIFGLKTKASGSGYDAAVLLNNTLINITEQFSLARAQFNDVNEANDLLLDNILADQSTESYIYSTTYNTLVPVYTTTIENGTGSDANHTIKTSFNANAFGEGGKIYGSVRIVKINANGVLTSTVTKPAFVDNGQLNLLPSTTANGIDEGYIDGANNSGGFVGRMDDTSDYTNHAFFGENDQVALRFQEHFNMEARSNARQINENGVIIGSFNDTGPHQPFIAAKGQNGEYELQLLDVDAFQVEGSWGAGFGWLNNNDIAVGGSPVAAIIAVNGQVYDLNALIDESGEGYHFLSAYGINDSNEIIVAGRRESDNKYCSVILKPLGTPFDFDSNFETMHMVGSHNGWSVTANPMDLVSDHSWELQIELNANDQFKFVPVSWAQGSFGDRDANGIADNQGGGNILIPDGNGTYTVSFNDETLAYSVTKQVPSNPPIAVDFERTYVVGSINLFSDESYDPDDDIVKWEWSHGFGEGRVVVKEINEPGIYEITFTITDSQGNQDTGLATITVIENEAPLVDAGPDQTVDVSQPQITLSGEAHDPDFNLSTINWRQISGPSVSLSNNESYITQFTHAGAGEYIFELEAIDIVGYTGSDRVTITVEGGDLESVYNSMHLVGSFNGWSTSATPMTLVASHTWQIAVGLDAGDNVKFVPVSWANGSYGDVNQDGIADNTGGGNIIVPNESGLYVVTFNDQTKAYSFTQDHGSQPPIAKAGNDQTVKVGSEVTLSGVLSTDVNNDIVSYSWNNGFGEGEIVSKYMTSIGTFDITLTVTDAEGNSDADTVRITVQANQAPAVNAGPDQTVNVSQSTINLAGTASDSDGNIGSIRWTQTGGTPVTLTSPNSLNTSFINPGIGSHQFQLIVEDNDGKVSTDYVLIKVVDEPPKSIHNTMHLVGNFNGWSTTATPMTLVSDYTWEVNVTLSSGSVKFVPVSWANGSYGDVNQDGIADQNGGGNIAIPNGAGNYLVTFNDQTKAYTLVKSVGNNPPVAVGYEQNYKTNQTVSLYDAESTDPDNDIVKWEWSHGFGEGRGVSKVISTPGIYPILLTITDSRGNSDTAIVTITVRDNVAPVADAGPDITTRVGQPTTFENNSTDPDGGYNVFTWHSDAFTAELTGYSPSYTFTSEGVYVVTLTATDREGLSSSDTFTVTVEPGDISSVHDTMKLVGSFNNWSLTATPMTLVDNNTWQVTVDLDWGDELKFVPVSWAQGSYGDRNQDGIADQNGGGNIPTPSGPGRYLVTFNDLTKAYSLANQ